MSVSPTLPLPRHASISDRAADELCAPWTLFRQSRPRARVRLLCFPHAGGSALSYRDWGERLPETIELCPIQLPGRSSRASEPPLTSVAALLDVLLPAIEPLFDRPFALFGHSMGAMLAFALAEALEQRGLPPLRLFAAGRWPPLPGSHGVLHRKTDAELTDYLREMGGTPEIVFADADLRALVFRLLRADLKMNDQFSASRALRDVPISTLAGRDDIYASPEALLGWSTLTAAGFESKLFSGGHFFPQQQQAAVVRYVIDRLNADLEGRHAGAR